MTVLDECFLLNGSVNGFSLTAEANQTRKCATGRMPLVQRISGSAGPRFKALVCKELACAPEEYERRLFRRCLHWHAVPLAAVLAKLNPGFFCEDSGLIADLATASSHSEVLTELNRFYGRNVRDRNWVRRTFSLRISGKSVLRLSRRLFQSSE